jgi:hypothetical protein
MSAYLPIDFENLQTPLNEVTMDQLQGGIILANTKADQALASQPPVPVNGQWLKGQGGAMTWAAIQQTDVQGLVKGVANGYAGLDAAAKVPVAQLPAISARVYSNTNQPVNSAASTQVYFDLERFDTDNIHDVAANSTRLTCRTAGRYLIGGGVRFAGNVSGIRSVVIRINGATTIVEKQSGAAPGGAALAVDISSLWEMAVGDYAELIVYQDSGAQINVLAIAAESPEFWMVRVS